MRTPLLLIHVFAAAVGMLSGYVSIAFLFAISDIRMLIRGGVTGAEAA